MGRWLKLPLAYRRPFILQTWPWLLPPLSVHCTLAKKLWTGRLVGSWQSRHRWFFLSSQFQFIDAHIVVYWRRRRRRNDWCGDLSFRRHFFCMNRLLERRSWCLPQCRTHNRTIAHCFQGSPHINPSRLTSLFGYKGKKEIPPKQDRRLLDAQRINKTRRTRWRRP